MYTHNMVKNIFTFSGRSGRGEYVIFSMMYLWIMIALLLVGLTSTPTLRIVFWIATIPFYVGLWALAIRRIRDMGLSMWFVLALLMPHTFFILWGFMLFAPTDVAKKKPNNGQEPGDEAGLFTHHIIKDIFTFSGRSGRVEYLSFTIVYGTVGLPVSLFLSFPLEIPTEYNYFGLEGIFIPAPYLMAVMENPSSFTILTLLWAILFWIITASVIIRRIRDMGLSPWFFLGKFISYTDIILWLFLLFAPRNTFKKPTNSEPKSSEIESAEVSPNDAPQSLEPKDQSGA